jgi:hypothetical protein
LREAERAVLFTASPGCLQTLVAAIPIATMEIRDRQLKPGTALSIAFIENYPRRASDSCAAEGSIHGIEINESNSLNC